MLAHFLNNAVIVLDLRFGFLAGVTGGAAAALYAVSGVCLVAVLVWLIFFDRGTNRRKEGALRSFLLPASVGIGMCAIMWIVNFAAGIGG